MWRRGDEVFAEVTLPADAGVSAAGFGVHPVMLDAALHAVVLASDSAEIRAQGSVLVPFSWQHVSLHAAGASAVRARIVPVSQSAVSIELADGLGLPVLSVASMVARPVTDQQLLAAVSSSGPDRLFEVIWSPQPSPRCSRYRWLRGTSEADAEIRGLSNPTPVAGDVVAEVYAATHAALPVAAVVVGPRRGRERWWWRPGARWRCPGRTSPIWRARRCGAWCGRRRPSIPAGSCWSTPMRRSMATRSQRLWRVGEPQVVDARRDGLHRAGARQPRGGQRLGASRMTGRGGWA